MSKQAKVKIESLRSSWTGNAIDFVNRLIQRKRHRRLGENGISELKNHKWLQNFPWKYLRNKIIRPEYVPKRSNENFDYRNVNKKEFPLKSDISKLLKKNEFQEMFQDYEYKEDEHNKRHEGLVTMSTRSSSFE
jgi:hypothetical protein